MRAFAVVVLLVAAFSASAGASSTELRARVAPSPKSLNVRTWSPVVTLTDKGKPASAKLALTIRKGTVRRSFTPRAVRRGSYRARVTFPADGRWQWTLAAGRKMLARGAVSVSTRVAFELPYDLALEPDGTVLFLDRSRVLALDAGRVRVHARTPATELVALERMPDGTLFAIDFPGNRVLRIDPAGRVTPVASVAAPADLVADDAGTTLWVASIADGVGVVRVDVASGRVEPFAAAERPHGIDRTPDGDFYVHDGTSVSRVDGDTGARTPFAAVDAFKQLVAPDGSVYAITGSPSGGRIVRIAPDGSVSAIAGTGGLGPHRDGPALGLGILPSAVALTADGDVLFTQIEPVPALRRLDTATGLVTTLARGR